MTDVATALAPFMPTFLDIAGTLLGGAFILIVREGVSILQHWCHISVTATQQAELERAATNAAQAIVGKAPTSDIINEAFSVDDPRIKLAANWIVNESTEHADAVKAIAADADDMAHKIVAKLGAEQIKAAAAPVVVPVDVAKV